jgi:hypothetical protein
MDILIISALAILVIVMWIGTNRKNEPEEGRTFQGMDVEEYIKNQVGEDYYNKHYKK